MNKYLTAFCVYAAVVGCSVAMGEESADSGVPTCVSGLVRWAEYVSLDTRRDQNAGSSIPDSLKTLRTRRPISSNFAGRIIKDILLCVALQRSVAPTLMLFV